MIKNESEIWRALRGVPGIEVSTLGRVRTLDRIVSSVRRTYLKKGIVLKQYSDKYGYPIVNIQIDGKWTKKKVHRLVAETFLSNPDNLPMVNHKNCIRDDNRVDNLEFCTASYNNQYREKFGKSLGFPLFAVNLDTLEVLQFKSQHEASRTLGINQGHINSVIKGRRNQTHGFWFVNEDDNAADTIKQKLYEIKHRSTLKIH